MTAISVLNSSVCVSTILDNLPVVVTGKSIGEMLGKLDFEKDTLNLKTKLWMMLVAMTVLSFASTCLSEDIPPTRGLREVNHDIVELQGGFWGLRQDTHHKVTVPHALDCLEKAGHGHHWFGNAESYFLIGDSLAQTAIELMEDHID